MLMIAPKGKSPPLGLEIGEKLLWKYDETRYFVFNLNQLCKLEAIVFKQFLSSETTL